MHLWDRGGKKSPTEKRSNGKKVQQKKGPTEKKFQQKKIPSEKKSKDLTPVILTTTNSNNTSLLVKHLLCFYNFSGKKVRRKKSPTEKKFNVDKPNKNQ